MAMIGLPKSESLTPVARHSARAPAMLRPWVEVALRYCGMSGSFSEGLLERRRKEPASGEWPALHDAVLPQRSLRRPATPPRPRP